MTGEDEKNMLATGMDWLDADLRSLVHCYGLEPGDAELLWTAVPSFEGIVPCGDEETRSRVFAEWWYRATLRRAPLFPRTSTARPVYGGGRGCWYTAVAAGTPELVGRAAPAHVALAAWWWEQCVARRPGYPPATEVPPELAAAATLAWAGEWVRHK